MRKFTLILLSAFFCELACAQSLMNRDSLLRLLPNARKDTALVHLYISIGQQYELDEPEKAKEWYRKVKQLSEEIAYPRGFIKYATNYTAVLNQEAKFDSSLAINKQALKVSHELNDPRLIGINMANVGNVFQYMGTYDSAAYYYERSKPFFEQAGDKNSQARLDDQLQNLYNSLRQHKKAIQHGESALAYFRTTADTISLGHVLLNLGNNYSNGLQFDKAGDAYSEVLAIARRTSYKRLELSVLESMGDMLMKQSITDNLKLYYEPALKLSKEINDKEAESIANRGLGLHYLFAKSYYKSKHYFEEALAISEENGLQMERIKNLNAISSLYFAIQKPGEGEKYLQQSTRLRDSITGDEMRNKVVQLEKFYETERKDIRIQLQQEQIKQKSTLNYILLGSAFALSVISLLGYRNHRHKQKLQHAKIAELEAEKQLSATEAVLKGEEQERTRLAKDLHDGLGGMLSGIKFSFQNMKENLILTPENAEAFGRSIDMLDSSIKEMRRVAHNMMPEMLVKYGLNVALKEFCNEINRSGVVSTTYQSMGMDEITVEQTTAVTVYRIIQELVHNAIKHANARNLLVQVHASGKEGILSVTVEDDGKGFDTTLIQHEQGIGWSNIRNRIDFLKGKVDLNSSPEKGTSVLLEIPLS